METYYALVTLDYTGKSCLVSSKDEESMDKFSEYITSITDYTLFVFDNIGYCKQQRDLIMAEFNADRYCPINKDYAKIAEFIYRFLT